MTNLHLISCLAALVLTACAPQAWREVPPILLFTGTGTSPNDVKAAGVGTPAIEHYWEDGPQYTSWGAVVGKYPDGTPAIVEGRSGKGWVLLVGTHPEAPEGWRRGMIFTTPAGAANLYAGTLIDAALHGTSLPHY